MTSFDTYMRKQADGVADAQATLGAIHGALDPDQVAKKYEWEKANKIHSYTNLAKGVADKIIPGISGAASGLTSYMSQPTGNMLADMAAPKQFRETMGAAHQALNPQAPQGPQPAMPVPDESKLMSNLTQGGTLSGYISGFQRARSVDAMTSQYLDPQGRLKVDEFAKAAGIDIDPRTQQGATNRAILANPRFLNQTNQALSAAGQGAWNWAKANPWLVGGGLGLAGLAAYGLMGGDDDEEEETPRGRDARQDASTWSRTRNWQPAFQR